MLYDLGVVPPPRSLTESVFTIITHRRQAQEFYRTKTLVEAMLAPHSENSKGLEEAMDLYLDALMPHLKRVRHDREVEMKRTLEHWTSQGPLKVIPLWMSRKGKGGSFRSALKEGAEKARQLGEERRKGRFRRLV